MAITSAQQIRVERFMQKNPLYKKWRAMKQRCQVKSNASYSSYGKRGIKICPAWFIYKNFEMDMLPTYKKGLSLDRIDNNKNYSPENCRWSTPKEQAINRRNNHFYEYKGIRDTLTNWSNYFKVSRETLWSRLNSYNWSMEKALFLNNKGGF